MWNTQKLGGLAAFAQIGLAALALLADLVLLPAAGLSPVNGQLPDAASVVAKNSDPTLVVLDIGMLLLSQTIWLVWAGLYDRLGSRAPNRSRLALLAATMASVFFAATAVISMNSRSMLATISKESEAATVDLGVRTLTGGLAGGGAFMMGWAAVLSGWATISKGGLPRLLSGMLLLSGASLMLPVLMSAIPSGLNPVMQLLVGIAAEATVPVWTIWLGLVLWRGL
jgi:hypothetical protein